MESKVKNNNKKSNVSIGGLIAILASIATIIGLFLQWQQTKAELAAAEDARHNAEADISIKETSLAVVVELRDLQATSVASGNYSAPLQATLDELNKIQSTIAPNLPTVQFPSTTTPILPIVITSTISIITATPTSLPTDTPTPYPVGYIFFDDFEDGLTPLGQ